MVAQHFKHELVQAVSNGLQFRIVGDNVNWKAAVRDQREDSQGHMEHAFGSLAIINRLDFSNLNTVTPQVEPSSLSVQDLLPSQADMDHIKYEYAVLIGQTAAKLIPALAFLAEVIPQRITGSYSTELSTKSKVFPLPVLYLNEQKYQDVVQIMDYYEQLVHDIYSEANKPFSESSKIHIGGDQLTRERFSGAKRLRARHTDPCRRFDHLGPITFEFFHMMMNLLEVLYKHLYADSRTDFGSMRSLQERINRSNVQLPVKHHYDADKDFAVSFVNAYIAEAVLHYFGMEDINDTPTKNLPSDWSSATLVEKRDWFNKTFTSIVETYVMPTNNQDNCEVDGQVVTMKLANGQIVQLLTRPKERLKPAQPDHVKNYGHLVLEIGMLFKALYDMIHIPDRDRGIRLLKLAMVVFKADKNQSKYALEILRLLVHQLCSLSEKAAHEEFYALFVNTKGHIDSHIPVDLCMEHQVRTIKRHLRHMTSNKNEKTVMSRSCALPGIARIGQNYDNISSVSVHSRKHSQKSSDLDELTMLSNLRRLQPFTPQNGRAFTAFPVCSASVLGFMKCRAFHQWLLKHKNTLPTEIGN